MHMDRIASFDATAAAPGLGCRQKGVTISTSSRTPGAARVRGRRRRRAPLLRRRLAEGREGRLRGRRRRVERECGTRRLGLGFTRRDLDARLLASRARASAPAPRPAGYADASPASVSGLRSPSGTHLPISYLSLI